MQETVGQQLELAIFKDGLLRGAFIVWIMSSTCSTQKAV
jgi:hypothetical protein